MEKSEDLDKFLEKVDEISEYTASDIFTMIFFFCTKANKNIAKGRNFFFFFLNL